MSHEMTDWFEISFNMKFFIKIINSQEIIGQNVVSNFLEVFSKNFTTLNLGVSFFKFVTIEGYMFVPTTDNPISFPVPGFRIRYVFNF